jgi:hypothetical protein
MSVEIKKRLFYLKLKSLIQNQKRIQEGLEIATLAGGCFWCTEAVFLELEGVHAVISGYIGVKQLILPIRKYVMEIRDMQKQLKSLSILLKSDRRLLEIFCNTRSDYDKSPRE